MLPEMLSDSPAFHTILSDNVDDVCIEIKSFITTHFSFPMLFISLPRFTPSTFSAKVEAQICAMTGLYSVRVNDLSPEGLILKLMRPVYATLYAGIQHLLGDSLLLSMPEVETRIIWSGQPRTLCGDHYKDPDASFRPVARDSNSPSLVIEVGDSPSMEHLRRGVKTWFLNTEIVCVILLSLSAMRDSFGLQGEIYRSVNSAASALYSSTSEAVEALETASSFVWQPGDPLPDFQIHVYDLLPDKQYLPAAEQHRWTQPTPLDQIRLQRFTKSLVSSWKRDKVDQGDTESQPRT